LKKAAILDFAKRFSSTSDGTLVVLSVRPNSVLLF